MPLAAYSIFLFIEVSPSDILQFVTGSTKIPAAGFTGVPYVAFTDLPGLPTSSCDLNITFSRSYGQLCTV